MKKKQICVLLTGNNGVAFVLDLIKMGHRVTVASTDPGCEELFETKIRNFSLVRNLTLRQVPEFSFFKGGDINQIINFADALKEKLHYFYVIPPLRDMSNGKLLDKRPIILSKDQLTYQQIYPVAVTILPKMKNEGGIIFPVLEGSKPWEQVTRERETLIKSIQDSSEFSKRRLIFRRFSVGLYNHSVSGKKQLTQTLLDFSKYHPRNVKI